MLKAALELMTCSHLAPGAASLTALHRLKHLMLVLFPGPVSVVSPCSVGECRSVQTPWGTGLAEICQLCAAERIALPQPKQGGCEDAARQPHRYFYSPPTKTTPTLSFHREAAFLLSQIHYHFIQKDVQSKKGPCHLLVQRNSVRTG